MEFAGSLLLVLAVGLLVGLFISQPFLRKHIRQASGEVSAERALDHKKSALLAERDRVLTALQELDFDHAMGKVPEDEYPIQRSMLLQAGAEALRNLDAMTATALQSAQAPTTGNDLPLSETVEERIEAAVQARRADLAKATGVSGLVAQSAAGTVASNGGNAKDQLEDLIAARKRERKESAAGFCPHCGKPVQKSDKYCARCGATL